MITPQNLFFTILIFLPFSSLKVIFYRHYNLPCEVLEEMQSMFVENSLYVRGWLFYASEMVA